MVEDARSAEMPPAPAEAVENTSNAVCSDHDLVVLKRPQFSVQAFPVRPHNKKTGPASAGLMTCIEKQLMLLPP